MHCAPRAGGNFRAGGFPTAETLWLLKRSSIEKRHDIRLTKPVSPFAPGLGGLFAMSTPGPKGYAGCYTVNQFPAFGESEIFCNGLR